MAQTQQFIPHHVTDVEKTGWQSTATGGPRLMPSSARPPRLPGACLCHNGRWGHIQGTCGKPSLGQTHSMNEHYVTLSHIIAIEAGKHCPGVGTGRRNHELCDQPGISDQPSWGDRSPHQSNRRWTRTWSQSRGGRNAHADSRVRQVDPHWHFAGRRVETEQ